MLTTAEVRAWRMSALLLSEPATQRTVHDIVHWHGAMQAQEWNSALWSLGVRQEGATLETLSAQLEDRSIVRTWPTRGTLQWVPSEDARWMVRRLGRRPLADAANRRAYLEISDADAAKAVDTLGQTLAGGKRLSRAACVEALKEAGLDVTSQRAYHLIWYASQLGVTAIAPHVGKDQTIVLLDDWADHHNEPDDDEALSIIAHRYVRSHGPVNAKELARWAGISITDARTGLAGAAPHLREIDTEHGTAWVDNDATAGSLTQRAWALPGFDEYLLGYGDRTGFATTEQMKRVIPGNNGVFKPTLVLDGQVVGMWERKLLTKSCRVTATDLVGLTAKQRELFTEPLTTYGQFLGVPVSVDWST